MLKILTTTPNDRTPITADTTLYTADTIILTADITSILTGTVTDNTLTVPYREYFEPVQLQLKNELTQVETTLSLTSSQTRGMLQVEFPFTFNEADSYEGIIYGVTDQTDLVVDGDFSNGTASWTPVLGWSISGGSASFDGDYGTAGSLTQDVGTTSRGVQYNLTYTGGTDIGYFEYGIGVSLGGGPLEYITSTTDREIILTSGGGTDLVFSGNGFDTTISDITLIKRNPLLWRGKIYVTDQTDLENFNLYEPNTSNDIITI
jgi:hypothetical protein